MNYIYMQCDCRYNEWLLDSISDKLVIEYTIEKCQQISEHVIAGIYDCAENNKLVDILEAKGVSVVLSKEGDVSKRFLNTVTTLDGNFVVRVGGDQLLIDVDKIKDILCQMENGGYDWFVERVSMSLLPDTVRISCLYKYKKEIESEDRYFRALNKIPNLKRYKLPYPIMLPYNFRANTNCNFRVCKSIIENKLDIYEISAEVVRKMAHTDSYLVKTGLLESWIIPFENADFYYDEDNKVNPWLGRTVIDVIKKHLNDTLNVFEWGMGNSTLFWSQYVNEVISVDHDQKWYQRMKEIEPQNADCRWVKLEYGGDYCKEIYNTDIEFDIIMIDGRDRVRCAMNAVDKLKSNGVIIWDNTEREFYQEGIDFLKKKGFKQLELCSVLYGNAGYECFTSIFYREDNIFDI